MSNIVTNPNYKTISYCNHNLDATAVMDLVLSIIPLTSKQTIAYIETLESKDDKDIVIAIRMAHNIGLKGIR